MNRTPMLAGLGIAGILLAQTLDFRTGYTDTPHLPGSPWPVNEDARPRPPEGRIVQRARAAALRL